MLDGLLHSLGLLHISTDHSYILRPAESHHTFGAGFILLGTLMMTEGLAGGVWHRSQTRTMMFPATLMFLGFGMLVVTAIEPQARFIHFAMGLPMIIGGYAEARYRLGYLRRSIVDALLVPALIFAAMDTALFHISSSDAMMTRVSHGSLAILVLILAALRLFQSRQPTSLPRSLLVGMLVIGVGCVLFLDAIFQPVVAS